ncbi:MAG TPA: hypothetical protein VFW28_01265 [Micropepsaceae bacterium]|nr:hypothetical protein [Micropepsaceae bacterium]
MRSARANILLDLWCVLFVAGVWFGVYDWSKTKDRPAEVRRKPPLVQIPLLQQVIGFIVGSASQLALGNGVQWILDHLIPWLVQEVFGVFVLSFGVGALIGCSIFDGGRMFRD